MLGIGASAPFRASTQHIIVDPEPERDYNVTTLGEEEGCR